MNCNLLTVLEDSCLWVVRLFPALCKLLLEVALVVWVAVTEFIFLLLPLEPMTLCSCWHIRSCLSVFHSYVPFSKVDATAPLRSGIWSNSTAHTTWKDRQELYSEYMLVCCLDAETGVKCLKLMKCKKMFGFRFCFLTLEMFCEGTGLNWL